MENGHAIAFRTGEKVTLEYLNSRMMADNLQLTVIYKSNLPRQKAKELYPEWYRRRIEEGQDSSQDGLFSCFDLQITQR